MIIVNNCDELKIVNSCDELKIKLETRITKSTIVQKLFRANKCIISVLISVLYDNPDIIITYVKPVPVLFTFNCALTIIVWVRSGICDVISPYKLFHS